MKVFIDPYYIRYLLPKKLVWNIPVSDKSVFLTFDDGPTSELTLRILDILDEHGIKATFFCVGQNVERHPELYTAILERGHAVGNHTYNHLRGWKTPYKEYLDNIQKCSKLVDSKLYRPPYGRISYKQYKALKKEYILIMWSVLTRDWDQRVSDDQSRKIAFKGLRRGANIIFHDNLKAKSKIENVLPGFISTALEQGYKFDVLNENLKLG